MGAYSASSKLIAESSKPKENLILSKFINQIKKGFRRKA